MGFLRVKYEPNSKDMKYTIHFNLNEPHNVREASTFSRDFTKALRFIVDWHREELNVVPHMQSLRLEVEGELPRDERTILDRFVALHNELPNFYKMLSDPKSYKSIGEYFRHIPIEKPCS